MTIQPRGTKPRQFSAWCSWHTTKRRKFCNYAHKRSIFQWRRWRGRGRPSWVAGCFRLARWGPISSILALANSTSSGSRSDAVEDLARLPPGSAAPIGPARRHRHQRFDDRPWFVRQVFASCLAVERGTTVQGFMRPLLISFREQYPPPLGRV